jgi:hypothetical protein
MKVNFTTQISPCPFEMLALDLQRGNMMQKLAVTIFFLLHFFQDNHLQTHHLSKGICSSKTKAGIVIVSCNNCKVGTVI